MMNLLVFINYPHFYCYILRSVNITFAIRDLSSLYIKRICNYSKTIAVAIFFHKLIRGCISRV